MFLLSSTIKKTTKITKQSQDVGLVDVANNDYVLIRNVESELNKIIEKISALEVAKTVAPVFSS